MTSVFLTENQIESVADELRGYNFEFPDDMDNEIYAKIIQAVLDGLGIDIDHHFSLSHSINE